MDVAVLGQPDQPGDAIGEKLAEALMWTDATEAWFGVAWAKRSGLRLVESELRAFRNGRRSLRALIGVDQHGATIEGLELVLDLFTEARVYHDINRNPPRTFHPKFYVVEARGRARAIVGSGNLTAGGLYTNYELSLCLDLDSDKKDDSAVLRELRSWFDARWSCAEAAIRLSKSSIKALIDDPEVVVVPEEWGPPRSFSGTAEAEEPKGKTKKLFGGPVRGLTRAPKPSGVERADRADSVVPRTDLPGAPRPGDDARVLAARLPKDRWGQAGFNKTVSEEFFGVRVNGETISAQAVGRDETPHAFVDRSLVFPSTSNRNHRIELPDSEARSRPTTGRPIVLVHEIGRKKFRYQYLFPSDRGYRTINREIDRRQAVGTSRGPETKRVYLTFGELRRRWSGCPLIKLGLP